MDNKTEAPKHYKRSASQISRIIRCPGSVDFIQYLIKRGEIPKEETTDYAEEGVFLHSQQEISLKGGTLSGKLNTEQLQSLEDNTNWFYSLLDTHGFTEYVTETQRNLDGFCLPDTGGTCDVLAKGEKDGKTSLHAIDWKFGRGVQVDAKSNEQLMTYLLTAIGNADNFDNYDEYWVHIGQPRLSNFGSYQCTKDELKKLVEDIRTAIKSYDIVAGSKQCFWCRGKVNCQEYIGFVVEAATDVFAANRAMEANYIDFKELARVYAFERLFKKIFKAIRDRLMVLDAASLAELNLKRVAGRSIRTFTDCAKATAYLIEHYNIDDIYETPTLKSPAQLEKSIKGLKTDKTFQGLLYKPIGIPTITNINDKRPEFDTLGAESAFAYLKKE